MTRLFPLTALALVLCAGVCYAKPAKHPAPPSEAATISAANRAALQQPTTTGYLNAIQVYPFMDGAIYRLFTAPDRVSDIALQTGEQLTAISSGDTARWVIGDTTSGSGTGKQVHILVKPYNAGLKTNLVVTTSMRTYHIQLESTPSTAMTAISWSYPQEALMAAKAAVEKEAATRPIASDISPESLYFDYALSGDMPNWRPVRVFDDGSKVYIEFPSSIAQGEAPPLFVTGKDGKAELVNYRIDHNYYVVDRLFEKAELRLGAKQQAIVRIKRRGRPVSQTTGALAAGTGDGRYD